MSLQQSLRRRLVLLLSACLGLGLSLVACAPKTQNECGFVQNPKGERISWKGRLPIVLKLHNSVPEEHEEAIKNSADTWNEALKRRVFVLDTESRVGGPNQTGKDTENVIYFYDNWEPERKDEQARTAIYWKGDLIEEADIRVNARDFKFYIQQEGKASPMDKVNMEALILHELGHVLGLRHQDIEPSVMATHLRNGADRVSLSSYDVKTVQCEY